MTEYLWTGESVECLCNHSIEDHGLPDSDFCCNICLCPSWRPKVKTVMEVRPPRPDYLLCDECTEVLANKLRFEQHKLQHKWQEENI